MLGAVVWTYWLHVPLLAAAVLGVLVTAVRYYRDFAVPLFEWRSQAEAGGQPAQLASVHALDHRPRAAWPTGQERRAA